MFLVGQCGFKFCSVCSLLAFIIPLQPFVASLCHTYIHPSSRLKWSCKHTHFSSCLQHLATTGPSLSVIHPVLWLNSRLLSKEIPQTQSSTRTASKRSFHFNKTLKAKQLFQKRGMAKRGCQTFFCFRSRCLRGTSVSNMQHTAAQHKSVRGYSIEPILIYAMLCPRNHS